jgi:DNA polymerase III delta prime subunit
MAKDDPLRSMLDSLAKSSGGRLGFSVRTSRELGAELEVELGTSTNPIYDFTVTPASGKQFRCVAYTNLVDASKRPASRVEALGSGLAAGDGKLFDLNPFLVVFDYVGQHQFMAVSASVLFGEFAKVADRISKSETAAFSMSPNFKNGTIKMYADLPAGSVIRCDLPVLTETSLVDLLTRMRDETASSVGQLPAILEAITTRLGSVPQPVATTVSVAAVPVPNLTPTLVRVDDRIRRMVRTAIRSAPAVILVGPPGTGKTTLLREVFGELVQNKDPDGLTAFEEPLWATPDESWTVRELVGGDTIIDGAIQFRPGWVLRAIAGNRWLVLDEMNRADMDRIFGGLLTWLSGGSVTLGTTSTAPGAPHIELGWNTEGDASERSKCRTEGISPDGTLFGAGGKVRYAAGEGWRLLGTYNALDAQRVFRFGAALGRRFVRVPIPAPSPALFAEVLGERATNLSAGMRASVEGLYRAHYAREETQLGPAVFLAMCNYLRASVPETGADEDSAADVVSSNDDGKALAEAYVVHAGTWLAHLDRRDLDALGERVRSGVMSPEDWLWVTQMIRSLA